MVTLDHVGGILDKIGGIVKCSSAPYLRSMGVQLTSAGKGAIIGGMIGGIPGAGLGLFIGEFYGSYKGWEIMNEAGAWRDALPVMSK